MDTPGGYSREFLVGVCRPAQSGKILTLFQTYILFSTPVFRLKSISVFRPGVGRNKVFIFRLELKQKDFLSLFFSLKRQIRLYQEPIYSRSFLENYDLFQSKMGKIYTLFQSEIAQNHTLWAAHTYIASYKGVPPRGGGHKAGIHMQLNSSLTLVKFLWRIITT